MRDSSETHELAHGETPHGIAVRDVATPNVAGMLAIRLRGETPGRSHPRIIAEAADLSCALDSGGGGEDGPGGRGRSGGPSSQRS